MKKLIISILAALFITVIIPLAIVELVPPGSNAASTEQNISSSFAFPIAKIMII